MKPTMPADDCWPEWLQDVGHEDPFATDPVVVSAVEETSDAHEYYRRLSTALVRAEKLEAVLDHPGGIGYEVSSSGPHPADSPGKWDYTPRFWVLGPEGEHFEPLAVAWRSGGDR